MEGMKKFPDNYFELAIVDPPYGIGMDRYLAITKPSRPNSYFYPQKHKTKDWDSLKPNKEYWKELFRISKNQVVFGGNYFTSNLYENKGWIFWDKINGEGSTFSDGELIWTSFDRALRKFKCSVFEGTKGGRERIHPTQKPIKLYEWLLSHYAKKGGKIIDTHVGSGSSIIAFKKHNFDYIGFEIDKDYYKDSSKRINDFKFSNIEYF